MLKHKWRPSHKCIYVIPEVHGNYNSLNIILDRILPLRKFKNQKDIIIMMGDYIDKGNDSYKVIDRLIEIKECYGERAIFLKGNHEQMLLDSSLSEDNFNIWKSNGGLNTIKSYMSIYDKNLGHISYNRLFDIVGEKHLFFYKSLLSHYILDDYVFFHGGFNILSGIENTLDSTFVLDYSSSFQIKEMITNKKNINLPGDYIFIGSHNYKSNIPFIHQKYFMLGGSAPNRLFILDLNSMQVSAIKSGKNNMYKYKYSFYE